MTIQVVIFALIGGFMPALFWLWFWLKEDKRKPEPASILFRAFMAGGLAVILAYYLEKLVCSNTGFLNALNIPLSFSWDCLRSLWIGMPILFSWSLIEELVKFLAFVLVVWPHRDFDEPIDAMIYMTTIAIGFAAIENSLFLLNTAMEQSSRTYFLLTGNFRFLGATILHIVSSSLVGYFIGRSFYFSVWGKTIWIFIGLITATLLHTAFNFFIIINNGHQTLSVFAVLWLMAIVVIFLFEKIKHFNRRSKLRFIK